MKHNLIYSMTKAVEKSDEVILIKDIDWCRSPYCRRKKEHTICKWGIKCPPAEGCETNIEFNKDMKDHVMELHNEKRNLIALGEEPNLAKNTPKAANIKILQWDIHLEFVARCHSRQCDPEHDHCRAVPRFATVGQNIYTKNLLVEENKNPDIQDIIEQAIESWYSQVENLPKDFYEKWNETQKPYAEFTQIIWATTSHIGCGLSQRKKQDSLEFFLVCNYGPKGNVKGKPIYIPGEPCSKCRKGRKCNSKFDGLCGNIEEYAVRCPCEEE